MIGEVDSSRSTSLERQRPQIPKLLRLDTERLGEKSGHRPFLPAPTQNRLPTSFSDIDAAESLTIRFVKLLVHDADERSFLLKVGVGWQSRRRREHATEWGCPDRRWRRLAERPVGHLEQSIGRGRFSRADPSSESFVRREQHRKCCDYKIERSINVVVPGSAEAAFRILEAKHLPTVRQSNRISTDNARQALRCRLSR